MSSGDTDVDAEPLPGTLWLARHAYVCQLGATWVLQDLARDRYAGIVGSAARSLCDRVPGWPASATPAHPTPGGPLSDAALEAIRNLIAEGVLTLNPGDGKPATPVARDVRQASLALDHNVLRGRRMCARDVARFVAACVATAWVLRRHSLQRAVEAVVARKRASARAPDLDTDLAADLVPIFRRLRSFTFSGHRRCLFHALSLTRFLASYGLHAQFVMGVKVEPWAAHSWVQYGAYVVDGTPEQVRFYTPILVV